MTTHAAPWQLHWLGTGSAQTTELTSASAVLLRDGEPVLMIDCGDTALKRFNAHHEQPPMALFITHAHFDHVGGLERLYYQLIFDEHRRGRCRLYVPANLVPVLQSRVADYPSPLAEGGANFWDAFQLIPVARGFWHEGLWFDVFAVPHHLPQTAFGIALTGSFLWTGDTRPIPAEIRRYGDNGAIIAHDCAVIGNPSHTGISDLFAEYDAPTRARMIVYHYRNEADAAALEAAGLTVARDDLVTSLPQPVPGFEAASRAWAVVA